MTKLKSSSPTASYAVSEERGIPYEGNYGI